MKRYLLPILSVFALMGMPFQLFCVDTAYGDSGNHYGWFKESNPGRNSHGVPDMGSTLSLLTMGAAAAGLYYSLLKGKRK